MLRFAASDLGLHCLPMYHIKDARLIWLKKDKVFKKKKIPAQVHGSFCIFDFFLNVFLWK